MPPPPSPTRAGRSAWTRSISRPHAAATAAPRSTRRIAASAGAARPTRVGGKGGQGRARRIGLRDLRGGAGIRWRWFDTLSARTALRLLTGPGRVAREYVLGARSRHFHPLKLLLVAVGLLLV